MRIGIAVFLTVLFCDAVTSGHLFAARRTVVRVGRADSAGDEFFRHIVNTVAQRKDMDFVDLGELVSASDPQQRQFMVDAKKADEGQAAISNLEVEQGIQKLQTAVRGMEANFAHVAEDASRLSVYKQALQSLAIGEFFAGNSEASLAQLHRLAQVSNDLAFDPRVYPPAMKHLFEKLTVLRDVHGTGGIEIAVTPRDATVRLNGHRIHGEGRLEMNDLPEGRHLVTAHKHGYESRAVETTVRVSDIAKVDVTLKAAGAGSDVMLKRQCGRLLNNDTNTQSLGAIAQRLNIDQIICTSLDLKNQTAAIAIFDGTTSGLKRVSSPIEKERLQPGAEKLVAMAFNPTHNVADSSVESQRSEREVSFFTKMIESRWFWLGVGTVVGAAVAGTVVGFTVAAQKRRAENSRIVLFAPGTP